MNYSTAWLHGPIRTIYDSDLGYIYYKKCVYQHKVVFKSGMGVTKTLLVTFSKSRIFDLAKVSVKLIESQIKTLYSAADVCIHNAKNFEK